MSQKNIKLMVLVLVLVLVVAVAAMMFVPEAQQLAGGFWGDGFCVGSASGSCGVG